jgi:Predicted transcriptional regulator containing an HTH domain and an uncharacterized domain shared with the mammalian protein Schlafen
MLDLTNLELYREDNRLEAKRALGGLPTSLWETYSAFANTHGGIILLGVEEHDDKSLHTINLPDPEKLVKDFWDTANNRKKVSVNILKAKNVSIETVENNRIIVIDVPSAERFYKPVYLNGNPLNTYKRSVEGDYLCTYDEYLTMVRDASVKTPDMLVLKEMNLSVFNRDSVRSYRQRMRLYHPGHVWETLDDDEFLLRLRAAAIGEDGREHPTVAGLLMFGNGYDIVREFNAFFLDYQEQYDENMRWTDRIISSSGEWSGNVYDFFFRVYNKLTQDIKPPFNASNGIRQDDTSVHQAIREALANCLVNADYFDAQELVIIKTRNEISFSNPGNIRIGIDTALSGGISDPRNATMLKMFNIIDIGERAGSGIPNIFRVWRDNDLPDPVLKESTFPNRTTLSLAFPKTSDKKQAIKPANKKASDIIPSHTKINYKASDKKQAIKTSDKTIFERQSQMIIEYLTKNERVKTKEIALLLEVSEPRAREILSRLAAKEKVIAEGRNRSRIYRLNS